MNDKPTPPRRRWYQFSLRTFFVLVTLLCVGFGYWVHWSKEWIRRRNEWRENNLVYELPDGGSVMIAIEPTTAPYGLWFFGEVGIAHIRCVCEFDGASERSSEAILLFPEAKPYWVHFGNMGPSR
jgi:hypothetical protein